jgi:hypothetical protein
VRKTTTRTPKDKDDAHKLNLEAYVSLFHNTPSGRQILADLKASLDRPTYRPGMSPNDTLWLEGRRSVYLDIIASVGAGEELIESGGEEQQEPETEAPAVVEGGALTTPLD